MPHAPPAEPGTMHHVFMLFHTPLFPLLQPMGIQYHSLPLIQPSPPPPPSLLLQAMGIQRYMFFSIYNCDKYPEVPLMNIKSCTEKFLQASGLNQTTFRLCGFHQVGMRGGACCISFWGGARGTRASAVRFRVRVIIRIRVMMRSEGGITLRPGRGSEVWILGGGRYIFPPASPSSLARPLSATTPSRSSRTRRCGAPRTRHGLHTWTARTLRAWHWLHSGRGGGGY